VVGGIKVLKIVKQRVKAKEKKPVPRKSHKTTQITIFSLNGLP